MATNVNMHARGQVKVRADDSPQSGPWIEFASESGEMVLYLDQEPDGLQRFALAVAEPVRKVAAGKRGNSTASAPQPDAEIDLSDEAHRKMLAAESARLPADLIPPGVGGIDLHDPASEEWA